MSGDVAAGSILLEPGTIVSSLCSLPLVVHFFQYLVKYTSLFTEPPP